MELSPTSSLVWQQKRTPATASECPVLCLRAVSASAPVVVGTSAVSFLSWFHAYYLETNVCKLVSEHLTHRGSQFYNGCPIADSRVKHWLAAQWTHARNRFCRCQAYDQFRDTLLIWASDLYTPDVCHLHQVLSVRSH